MSASEGLLQGGPSSSAANGAAAKSPKKQASKTDSEKKSHRRRGPVGWLLSGLLFPFWLVWLLVRGVLLVLLFPFGGWRSKHKDEAKPGEVQKKLENLTNEESAIVQRMEKRNKIWRAASRSLIVYSAGLEIVLVVVAFLLLRSSAPFPFFEGADPLLADFTDWEQLLKRWLLALSPVLLIPGLSTVLYSIMNKVFRAREKNDQAQLENLREQQKQQLESLLNEANFKATLQLLQKYGKEVAAAGLLGSISGVFAPPSTGKGPKAQQRRAPAPNNQGQHGQQQRPQHGQGAGPLGPGRGPLARDRLGMVPGGDIQLKGGEFPSQISRHSTTHSAWSSSAQAPGAAPSEVDPSPQKGVVLPGSFEFPMMPASPGDMVGRSAGSNISAAGLRRRTVALQEGMPAAGRRLGAGPAEGEMASGGNNQLRRRGRSRSISDVGDLGEPADGGFDFGAGWDGSASGVSGRQQHSDARTDEAPWAAHQGGPGFRGEGEFHGDAQWEAQEQQQQGKRRWWHRDSFLGRLAGLLVGEDPQQCYALICRNCHSHNGLVRLEDLDYLSYICPLCHYFNKARRQLEKEVSSRQGGLGDCVQSAGKAGETGQGQEQSCQSGDATDSNAAVLLENVDDSHTDVLQDVKQDAAWDPADSCVGTEREEPEQDNKDEDTAQRAPGIGMHDTPVQADADRKKDWNSSDSGSLD